MEGEASLLAVVWQATKFLAAFALVIFLAAASSRYLAQRSRGGASAAFRILGALGLGAGRSVAAVQVGRRVLVLGLGDKSISLLTTLDDASELQRPEDPDGPPRGLLTSVAGVNFAQLLRSAIEKAGGRANRRA